MSAMVPIALFAFLPLAVLLFAVMPGRRAVIATYLVAWLFLPMIGYGISGLPEYTKVSASALACVLGTLIFNSGLVLKVRPSWLDVPMGLYLLSPVLTNTVGGGNGLYEGVATALTQTFMWGVPWLMGRVYFTDLEAARDLALGVVIGGLIYVPLCLIEVKMSPQLNAWVYGFHQHSFAQTRRGGGWRPMVFMQHGLALAMWMVSATLAALWMWRSGAMRRVGGVPAGVAVGALVVTAVLCKSTGALLLLAAGVAVLYLAKTLGSRAVLVGLVLVGPAYMALRATDNLPLGGVVSATASVLGKDRAASLETRLRNEQLIVNKSMERAALGWGGGGKYLVRDPGDPERILSVPDQFWVIALGSGGLLGLAAVVGVLLLPALVFACTCPARDLMLPGVAPLAVLSVLPVLFLIDCLMNAMMNPVFTLASAAVATVTVAARRAARQTADSRAGQEMGRPALA